MKLILRFFSVLSTILSLLVILHVNPSFATDISANEALDNNTLNFNLSPQLSVVTDNYYFGDSCVKGEYIMSMENPNLTLLIDNIQGPTQLSFYSRIEVGLKGLAVYLDNEFYFLVNQTDSLFDSTDWEQTIIDIPSGNHTLKLHGVPEFAPAYPGLSVLYLDKFEYVSSNSQPLSKYDFEYHYNDGSGDFYKGYVIHNDGLSFVGDIINWAHNPLGENQLLSEGYYIITNISQISVTPSDIGKVFVFNYYDGDTGKTSDTLYPDTSGKTSHNLVLAGAQGLGSEKGFVYDPSVPDDDDYFGNKEVVYAFSPNITNANFLVTYIKNLRYWNQPGTLNIDGGVCGEVAGAILLSHWYQNGYKNLFRGYGLDIDDGQLWGDNPYFPESGNDPLYEGYESLIWELHGYMGQDRFTFGNMEFFIQNQGYDFEHEGDLFWWQKEWEDLQYRLDRGEPVLAVLSNRKIDPTEPFFIDTDYVSHTVVIRGYWNDKRLCCNFGYGSKVLKNQSGDFLSNLSIEWGKKNDIIIIGSKQNIWNDVKIKGLIYFWPNSAVW